MANLLAVFAHPDDETFICGGTLAKYAAQGNRVVLVCATKGEMGRRMGVPPTATRESIPVVREEELREACDALRIAELKLLGLRDKSLEITPFESLVSAVLTHMEAEQPDAVVTFHEQYGGHPDHCTIGAAATAAFEKYRVSHPDARLYFIAWSHMYGSAQEHGLEKERFVQVDVSGYKHEKMLAFRAHKTQTGMNDWLWGNDADSIRHFGGVEYFLQGHAPYRSGIKDLL